MSEVQDPTFCRIPGRRDRGPAVTNTDVPIQIDTDKLTAFVPATAGHQTAIPRRQS
jgi:hypothetical protein